MKYLCILILNNNQLITDEILQRVYPIQSGLLQLMKLDLSNNNKITDGGLLGMK